MSQSFRGEVEALRGMFPAWDAQLLSELLEAHQGDLESTVDTVLTMDAPSSGGAAAAANAVPPPAPQSPKPATRHNQHLSPGGKPRGRVALPDDFLRLPSAGRSDSMSEQEQRDAILAQMMQDEFFREQVLSSDEFSEHFQGNRPSSSAAYPEKSATELASETYTAMAQKLSSMSEVMKSRMQDMYQRFQTRTSSTGDYDPKSHRPLMAGDSSDDSDDDDLSDNPDMRRQSSSPRRWGAELSPRRAGLRGRSSVTRRASTQSKKDN